MLFAVLCRDKKDSLPIRLANREAHLDYIRANWLPRLISAGPLFSPDGQTMIGGLLIFDVEDRAEIDRYLEDDPYGKAGLFESVDVWPYKKVFP
ncbi:MAG: YciI family protein [Alphaproteobacteria bacterium]|nr:YciI family protein [Alphaproteobacteria bacterium]